MANYLATSDDEQSWIPPQQPLLESYKRHNDVAFIPVEGVAGWVLETSEFLAWRGMEVMPPYSVVGLRKQEIPSSAPQLPTRYAKGTVGRNVDVACLYCDYRG